MRFLSTIVFFLILAPLTAGTRELIFPVVANGFTTTPVHFQTTVRLTNLSRAKVEVVLEAFQNDGTATRIFGLFPIAQPGTKSVFQIEPGGSVEVVTAGDVPQFNGWVRLTHDDAADVQATAEVSLINAPPDPHPICRRFSTEVLTSVLVPAVESARKFSAFVVNRPQRKTALAFTNPLTSQSAEVFLSLLDFEGKLVGSGSLKIPPQGRVSKFLAELLVSAPSEFMGSLRVTSLAPVAASALHVLFPESKLTSVLVTAAPPAVCIQVTQAARNPLSGECRVFPTPCDVPEGWQAVPGCN